MQILHVVGIDLHLIIANFASNIRAIEPLRWTLKTDFNIK